MAKPTVREAPTTRQERSGGGRLAAIAANPWVLLSIVALVTLAMSWPFMADPSRVVPAFDTAYYQWRAEYLTAADPGALVELRGATGALAAGYRVAEAVLGALMRTVGGVGPTTHTVVLSVLFRVLAAVGLAAFAWRHRRDSVLVILTIVAVPALFLLQKFFGYLDNFMTLALLAGVLILLDRMPGSWGARVAVTAFMFVAGMSHPTTLVIFLLAMGAVAAYRLLRERSLLAALRSEGLIVATGTVAVILTTLFWYGGLWGPTSSFSDAAVPPPADVPYFVERSAGVLKNLEPFYPVMILFPLMAVALVATAVRAWRDREYFSEVTVAWTLPLLGMLGFLVGAAYPYFRFFNATLAPLLLAAIGLGLVIWLGWRLRRRLTVAAPVVAVGLVAFVVFTWWARGLAGSEAPLVGGFGEKGPGWANSTSTWLTPDIRASLDAADAYMEAEPEGRRSLWVVDAQGTAQVPYGAYKEYANAIYAGLGGEEIGDTVLYFGSIEDLQAGRASDFQGDEIYAGIARETAQGSVENNIESAVAVLEREAGNLVVFMPAVFNDPSEPNQAFLDGCGEAECTQVGRSGLYLLPEVGNTPVAPAALDTAERAAARARAFAGDPPGPLDDLGSTILVILRLGLLLILPGALYYRRFRDRSWPEAIALVPMLSIASVTVIGMILLAFIRTPLTPTVGWVVLAIAVGIGLLPGLPAGIRRRRDALFAAPARFIDDTAVPFRTRDFTFLMGAQWFAQMADGIVGAALAKLITFGGQAGFDVEAARSTRDALFIVLMTFLPYSLFSPFVGVLIDRWDRRRLLIGANGIRTVILGAIVLLGVTTFGDAALFISFLLILAGTRLLLAIKGASLPAVLGERDLVQGNSISQAGSALFQLFGAGVALVLSEAIDARVILVGGVLGYAVATLCAWGIRKLGYATRTEPLGRELRRLFRDLADGVREVSRKAAAGLSLLSFLVVRSLLTMSVLATGFLSRELIGQESTVALVAGAVGALGAGLGFVLAYVLRTRVKPTTIVSGALILGGAGMLAFGGIINTLGISLMAFSVGLSFFLGKVGVDTLMQQSLSDSFRGRGFSFQDLVYNLSWILPALILFVFLSEDTARILLVAAGGVFLAIAILIALWARRIELRPAEAGARPSA
jgi:MFS family permease